MANYVGWQKNGRWLSSYSDLTFNLTANKGHLPLVTNLWDIVWKHEGFSFSFRGKVFSMGGRDRWRREDDSWGGLDGKGRRKSISIFCSLD